MKAAPENRSVAGPATRWSASCSVSRRKLEHPAPPASGQIRGITVGPPGQPGPSILLASPAADRGITDDDRRTIAEMMSKRTFCWEPSRPEGVPVWSVDGIVCIGEMLKNAVRLTFPKGVRIKGPKNLLNARLDSTSVRAIDFREGEKVPEAALKELVLEAAGLNV